MIVDPSTFSRERGWVIEYPNRTFGHNDGKPDDAPRQPIVAVHVWQPRGKTLIIRRYADGHMIGFNLENVWRVAWWTMPQHHLVMDAWHDSIITTDEPATGFVFEGFHFFDVAR